MADTMVIERNKKTERTKCTYIEAYMYHNPVGTVLERLKRVYSNGELAQKGFTEVIFEGDFRCENGRFSADYKDSKISVEELSDGREAYFTIVSNTDESQNKAKEILQELLSWGEIVRLEIDPFSRNKIQNGR